VEIRTLVALAATMACGAVAANAASTVQTARVLEPAPLPVSLEDPSGVAPESPLAIAGALASDGAAIQIQLGSAAADPRAVTLPELPFEPAPH
jgi:hypothetical protein